MFEVMILIRRKPGMSMEEFVRYYETAHAPLGASKVPNMKRYVRHFLRPYGNAVYGTDPASQEDFVTELWFDDEADFQSGVAYPTAPETARIIGEDEDKLFDKSSIRFYVVQESEPIMPAAR